MGMFSENNTGTRCTDCSWADDMEKKLANSNAVLSDVRAIVEKAKSDICWQNKDLDLVKVIEEIQEKLSGRLS